MYTKKKAIFFIFPLFSTAILAHDLYKRCALPTLRKRNRPLSPFARHGILQFRSPQALRPAFREGAAPVGDARSDFQQDRRFSDLASIPGRGSPERKKLDAV